MADNLYPDRSHIEPEPSFLREVWELAEGVVAIGLVASFAAHVVQEATMRGGERSVAATAPITVNVPIPVPDPVIDLILTCVVLGIVTYMVLAWVCSSEWIKKKKKVKDCFKKKKWYNPFDWVRVLVCVFKWVVVKVLQTICGWKEVIVAALVIACVVVGLMVLL